MHTLMIRKLTILTKIQSVESFLSEVDNNTLTDEQRDRLDKNLLLARYKGMLRGVKNFPKKQNTGNDGLTVEFYLAFWLGIDTLCS